MQKYPASVPRTMYWSNEVGGTLVCPRCGELLESERHTYLIGIRNSDGETGTSMVGGEGGYFCPDCPTIVLNHKQFEDYVALAADGPASAFTAIGAVDLDAVPEERSHLPLGEDENPIPVVEFLDPPRKKVGKRSTRRKTQSRNQRKRKRKKRR
ncbi:MAG: hypothetical protein QNJ97_14810 [Myxococcota bacterium]|nr:hypothetical protein [Myxococcota bacterium]